jgi:hypothetical protein
MQDLLEPQLIGLVDDDEEQLIVRRRSLLLALSRLRVEDLVELQVFAVVQVGGHDARVEEAVKVDRSRRFN